MDFAWTMLLFCAVCALIATYRGLKNEREGNNARLTLEHSGEGLADDVRRNEIAQISLTGLLLPIMEDDGAQAYLSFRAR